LEIAIALRASETAYAEGFTIYFSIFLHYFVLAFPASRGFFLVKTFFAIKYLAFLLKETFSFQGFLALIAFEAFYMNLLSANIHELRLEI